MIFIMLLIRIAILINSNTIFQLTLDFNATTYKLVLMFFFNDDRIIIIKNS